MIFWVRLAPGISHCHKTIMGPLLHPTLALPGPAENSCPIPEAGVQFGDRLLHILPLCRGDVTISPFGWVLP
jgi:hypothetical protein